MNNLHEVFGLSPQASDEEIRNRYLQLVREFPPDRAPERFAEIRAAYDQLRDPLPRLERQLFHIGTEDSFAALMDNLRSRLKTKRLAVDAILSLAESR